MLELNQRWIHFYGVSLVSAPDDSPAFNVDECFVMLRRKFGDGGFFKLINKGTACIRVSDMALSRENRRVSFLFQYSDSRISDPSFSDLESGVLRSEPKLDGEGIAVSAHAIFYLDPIEREGLEYLMLLEDVPGIGKTKLSPFLNGFLKQLLSKEFINEDGAKNMCYPQFVFDHFASQSLQDDLEDGELKFIELIKSQTINELDEDPYLDRAVQTVRIKATPKASGQPAMDFINKVKNIGKDKGYRDMRVIFKKPEGKQRSVTIPTFREDAGEALFGRMEVVNTDYDLLQCAPEIDKKFLEKMRELT